jgi:hypothetical protein
VIARQKLAFDQLTAKRGIILVDTADHLIDLALGIAPTRLEQL